MTVLLRKRKMGKRKEEVKWKEEKSSSSSNTE